MVNTLRPPISVIATWPKPNYVNPTSLGDGVEVLSIVFASFGVLIVCARTYSRLFITRALGFDDCLVIAALGFLTALTVLVIVGFHGYHFGRHIWDIPPTAFVGMRANVWACFWCYITGITLIKISVLLFYRRLSVKFSKTFLIATWIGIIYNILYFCAFSLTLLIICQPLHSYWDSFSPVWAATHKWHCASEQVALPASSAFSVLGDLYSTLLPLVLVYHLDMPHRQKLALYALFALGFMAVAAGLVRTVLIYRVLNVNYDFTRTLYYTWVWAVVELYLALFAASAPSLKPFFRHFFNESVKSFSRVSKKRTAGDNTGHSASGMHQRSGADTAMSSYMTGPTKGAEADVERVGLAWAGETDEAQRRQTRFLQDTDGEQTATRHFELRPMAIQDGRKMVPMEVQKSQNSRHSTSSSERVASDPFVDPTLPAEYPLRSDSPRQNWPLSTVREAPQFQNQQQQYETPVPQYQDPPQQYNAELAEARERRLQHHHSLKYKYPPRAPLDRQASPPPRTTSPPSRTTSPPNHVAFQVNQSQGFF